MLNEATNKISFKSRSGENMMLVFKHLIGKIKKISNCRSKLLFNYSFYNFYAFCYAVHSVGYADFVGFTYSKL